MKIISIAVFLLSLIAIQINAEQAQKPTPDEVRLYMHGRLSQKEEIRIGRWMMKNGVEFLHLLLEIEETTDNTFIKSGTMHVISRSVSKENSQSVIERLLEADTSDVAKTTALEIAKKYGYEGERYRTVLIDVLTSTEYGGLQKRLLKLLQSYGREEDAWLALEIFKNTDNRHMKAVASDAMLAIGGEDIIDPWKQEIERLQAAEPERVRREEEEKERLSKENDITFGPMPEGPSWLDYIEKDLQSLKNKVTKSSRAKNIPASEVDESDDYLSGEPAKQKQANAVSERVESPNSKSEPKKNSITAIIAIALIAFVCVLWIIFRSVRKR